MSFAKRKFFFATLLPILGTLIFSSLFAMPVSTTAATSTPKEDPNATYTCRCKMQLKGIDSSQELCRLGGYTVDVYIGTGAPPGAITTVASLFKSEFGADATNRKCYSMPKTFPSVMEAINALGSEIEGMAQITKEGCTSGVWPTAIVDYSNGVYGVDVGQCTLIQTAKSAGSTNDGPSIDSFAGQVSQLNKFKANSLQGVIGLAIKTATGILGTIALAILIYGGLLWMTSAGNSSQVDKAQSVLIWGALGIFVIFGSYALITFVFQSVSPNLTQ